MPSTSAIEEKEKRKSMIRLLIFALPSIRDIGRGTDRDVGIQPSMTPYHRYYKWYLALLCRLEKDEPGRPEAEHPEIII